MKPYPGFILLHWRHCKHGYILIKGHVDDAINVSGHRLSMAKIKSVCFLFHDVQDECQLIYSLHSSVLPMSWSGYLFPFGYPQTVGHLFTHTLFHPSISPPLARRLQPLHFHSCTLLSFAAYYLIPFLDYPLSLSSLPVPPTSSYRSSFSDSSS